MVISIQIDMNEKQYFFTSVDPNCFAAIIFPIIIFCNNRSQHKRQTFGISQLRKITTLIHNYIVFTLANVQPIAEEARFLSRLSQFAQNHSDELHL